MYTSSRTQRGFTLIEILVVVAIIGILTAIAYASFSDARKNARDKAIKAEVEMLSLEARLYYERYSNFATSDENENEFSDCTNLTNTLFGSTADGSLEPLLDKIYEISSKNLNDHIYCAAALNSWAFAAPLSATVNENNITAWCVDSAGASTEITFMDNDPFDGPPPYTCPSS